MLFEPACATIRTMTQGIALCFLIVAAVAAAWLGFDLVEIYGGFTPWIAFGLAITLGAWALLEGLQAGGRS